MNAAEISSVHGEPRWTASALKACVGLLIAVGLAGRLSPFLDPGGRLFWQFMSEDGYYMQTIARNIGIGLGMTTADGTIPTNGVQPLATLLFAPLYRLAGGAKFEGVALVSLFSVLVAAVAAYYLYRVAARVLGHVRHGRELAATIAALWFAAPRVIAQSMNGLETGLYLLAIAFTLDYYLKTTSNERAPLSGGRRLMLGVLLGVTFLARNDAVFFIGGLLAAHLLLGGAEAGGGYRRRLFDCLVAGATSIAVAAPWLVYNYRLFGSIVPMSGIAEALGAGFGENLPHLPATLLEATFLYLLVPDRFEPMIPVIVVAVIGVAAMLVGFWYFGARDALASRRFFVAGFLFALAVSVFYGCFFGASYFLPRYTIPLSIFLWVGTCATAWGLLTRLFAKMSRVRVAAVSLVAVLLLEGGTLAVLMYAHGRSHMHKQVVEWVEKNVADSQWVGAIQTGTLGFFHDRTINLDGKVNPEALRARLHDGDVRPYVIRSDIAYLADWVSIASWVGPKDDIGFSKYFALVVDDPKHNLGVLRRIEPGDSSRKSGG
jgi:hypothetical protein